MSGQGVGAAPRGLAVDGPDPRILRSWYERAGVRRDPHRAAGSGWDRSGQRAEVGPSVEEQVRMGQHFFPSQLMPHATHPLVRQRGPQTVRAVAARHLFHYLSFTANFETRVVNRATARIAHGETDVHLPTAARADALKIYTDEGYHALYSLDLVARLEVAVRVPALPYRFRPFLDRLDEVGRFALPDQPGLAQMLQVVVFETLVTSILDVVPADPTVLGVVRETVADHARDERRHHAYFAAFFRELWTNLDTSRQLAAGRCLPKLIRHSLEPDLAPAAASLAAAGLTGSEIDAVLGESYPVGRRAADAAVTARHSVRLFRDSGVLEVPGVAEAFAAAGLVSADVEAPEPVGTGE